MDTIQILKMPDSSAMITLVHEEGGTEYSNKIGYFVEKPGYTEYILISNPEGLLYFVDKIGIDKLTEIQATFSQE
jgi:hypothetical protein